MICLHNETKKDEEKERRKEEKTTEEKEKRKEEKTTVKAMNEQSKEVTNLDKSNYRRK